MKLYISGPMSGYDDDNEPAFRAAAASLQANGYDSIVPHDLDKDFPTSTWGEALGRDVRILADDTTIDGIVLLEGWEQSDGARVEVLTALLRKKFISELNALGEPRAITRAEITHRLLEAIR